MTMYKNTALVLEGGGMLGAYLSGVLDVMLDNGLKFGGYAGTSAGATHLCNYLSEQRDRNRRVDVIHSASKRYMGWGNLIRTGDFFEVDYCYTRSSARTPLSPISMPLQRIWKRARAPTC